MTVNGAVYVFKYACAFVVVIRLIRQGAVMLQVICYKLMGNGKVRWPR